MRHDTERAIRRLEGYHLGTRLIPFLIAGAFLLPIFLFLLLIVLHRLTGGLL
jgi:hypothetical protein